MSYRRRNPFRLFLELAAFLTAYGFDWPWDWRKIPADRELTGGGSFSSLPSGGVHLRAQMDAAIDNTGSNNHTVTCTLRGAGGSSGATLTRGLPAGASLPLSGEGIESFTLDSSDAAVYYAFGPRGSVYPFASAPGGSVTAPTVGVVELGTITGATFTGGFKMAGFGTTLKMTPKKGVVLVTIFADFAQGATGDNMFMKLRYGTGTAPISGAAETGTNPGSSEIFFQPGTVAGLGATALTLSMVVPITGLTPGTAYWFDVSVDLGATSDQVVVWGGVVDLGA